MGTQSNFFKFNNTLYNPLELGLLKKEEYTIISESKARFKSNLEFKKHIESKFQHIFVSTLKSQELEIDYKNNIEFLLEELFIENEFVAKDWLNEIYISNYNDTKFLINILKIIGNLDKKLLKSFGIVISGSALIHKSVEVKEMAIRVFENWNTVESYTFLKNCTLTPKWLDDYKNEVLVNIEEELCLI
jgi:predicted transcriptional regulator